MRIILLFMMALQLAVGVKCQNSSTTLTTSTKTLPSVNPSTEGFSVERLKRIDGAIQSWVDQKKMNGAVALIARNGKIVYNKAFGYDDIDKKIPMRSDYILNCFADKSHYQCCRDDVV